MFGVIKTFYEDMFGNIGDMEKNYCFYLKKIKDGDIIYRIIWGLSKLIKRANFFHFLLRFYLFSHEL
jgi:hypothetical protein